MGMRKVNFNFETSMRYFFAQNTGLTFKKIDYKGIRRLAGTTALRLFQNVGQLHLQYVRIDIDLSVE